MFTLMFALMVTLMSSHIFINMGTQFPQDFSLDSMFSIFLSTVIKVFKLLLVFFKA